MNNSNDNECGDHGDLSSLSCVAQVSFAEAHIDLMIEMETRFLGKDMNISRKGTALCRFNVLNTCQWLLVQIGLSYGLV